MQAQIAALQTTVSALQSQLASIQSSNVFALNSFVSLDPNPARLYSILIIEICR
jgi:hypothetical protein